LVEVFVMSSYEPKKCKRCGGTGEEYRPDLQCNDGPWLDCIGCMGYGFEQTEESHRHFIAILGEAWRVGWPKIFRGDVEYHDMRALAERDPRLPFAWMLRETGSSIILPNEEAGARDPAHVFAVNRSFINAQDDDARLYWWDGRRLHHITRKAALIDLVRCVICYASGAVVGADAA
jgi:hypothetical protein